jgi:hypothetical protein
VFESLLRQSTAHAVMYLKHDLSNEERIDGKMEATELCAHNSMGAFSIWPVYYLHIFFVRIVM